MEHAPTHHTCPEEGWMTLDELSTDTGVARVVLESGIRPDGLLAGWYRVTPDGLRFRPGTADFVRWTSLVADSVIDGHITIFEAHRLMRRRSRRKALGLD